MKARKLDNRGVSAVEFALLMPAFLVLMVGMFEVGLQGAVAAALDIGARAASRVGVTGNAVVNGQAMTTTQARTDAMVAEVLRATGGLLKQANLTIGQDSYATIDDAASGTGKTSGPGAANAYVRYTLSYVSPLFTGDLGAKLLGRTSFTYTSSILVTNEPFPNN